MWSEATRAGAGAATAASARAAAAAAAQRTSLACRRACTRPGFSATEAGETSSLAGAAAGGRSRLQRRVERLHGVQRPGEARHLEGAGDDLVAADHDVERHRAQVGLTL